MPPIRLLINGGHGCHLLPAPDLGGLVTPTTRRTAAYWAAKGWPWAVDNGAYAPSWSPVAFLRCLAQSRAVPGCLWVAVPDVVADAGATARRWRAWAWAVAATGLPLAFVGQDGVTAAGVPWPQIAALFVGGSTAWKLGPAAADLVAAARRRGKWVHVGRVNSQARFTYAASIGADSIDGLTFSKFSRHDLPWGRAWAHSRQGQLWSSAAHSEGDAA